MNVEPGVASAASKGKAAAWIRAYALVAICAVALLLYLAARGKEVDGAVIALVALAMLATVAIVMPEQVGRVARNVSGFNIGGIVEVAFREEKRAQQVLQRLPVQKDEVEVGSRRRSDDPVEEVLIVRDKLEQLLRFARDALFHLPADTQAYDDVLRHLRDRGLLDRDEVAVCFYLLGDSVPSWPEANRREFLDAAWAFAVRLGTETWDRWARQQLAKQGIAVTDVPPSSPKHRADFAVDAGAAGRLIVAARVAQPIGSIDKVRQRWAEEDSDQAHILVVPDNRVDKAAKRLEDQPGHVQVMSIDTLVSASKAGRVPD